MKKILDEILDEICKRKPGEQLDLSYADLSSTNLRGADLSSANLHGANIRWVTGNNKEILTIQTGQWPVIICNDQLTIGCQQHSINDWLSFDDKKIAAMDPRASDFWKTWKPILKQIIDNCVKDGTTEEI